MWSIPDPDEAVTPALKKKSPKKEHGEGVRQEEGLLPTSPSHGEWQLILEIKDMAGGPLEGFQGPAKSLGDWLVFPSPSCALGDGPFVQSSTLTRNHCVLTMPLTAS